MAARDRNHSIEGHGDPRRLGVIGLVLVGSSGRMGRAIAEAATAAGGFRIKGRIDRPRSQSKGLPELDEPLAPGDVVVDFSSPEGTMAACDLCVTAGAALVSGTTGLDTAQEGRVVATARSVAVLTASNFSIGVLALRRAIKAALEVLPESWDVEIVERHHRFKADAPSGTALTLAHEIGALREIPESGFRHGRAGRVGPRPPGELGIHAVRGGTWVGDHTVLVAGSGEWLELRHVAQDRGAFAHGVLAAAHFVASAPAGMYHLEHLATRGRGI